MFKFDKHDYEYMDYILEHKKNVMKTFDKFCEFHEEFLPNGGLYYLKMCVLNHDNSKFDDKQFVPYCNQFFRKNKNDDAFNEAWKMHYTKECHHPELFIDHPDVSEMDIFSILEMCFDWHAMSMKFGGNSLEYFLNKKEKLATEFNFLIKEFAFIEKILARLNK